MSLKIWRKQIRKTKESLVCRGNWVATGCGCGCGWVCVCMCGCERQHRRETHTTETTLHDSPPSMHIGSPCLNPHTWIKLRVRLPSGGIGGCTLPSLSHRVIIWVHFFLVGPGASETMGLEPCPILLDFILTPTLLCRVLREQMPCVGFSIYLINALFGTIAFVPERDFWVVGHGEGRWLAVWLAWVAGLI